MLPIDLKIMDALEQSFQQALQFDLKPKYCESCMMVGYVCPRPKPPNSTFRPIQVQPPKQKPPNLIPSWFSKPSEPQKSQQK